MRKVFLDTTLEELFSEQGYVIVPLLESDEVEYLTNYFKKNSLKEFSGYFYSTHFLKDRQYKRDVNNTLRNIFSEALSKLLYDYTIHFCNFMVKMPGAESIMPLHADWTFVDEPTYKSIAVWSPLINTDRNNGTLGVIPGSHKIITNIRGPKIESAFHENNEYLINKVGNIIPLKAGEAIIYDHRLLHFSPPNLSTDIRVACNIILTPTECSLYHYCILERPGIIEMFEVDSDDFFIEYDVFERPSIGKSIKYFKDPKISVSKETIDRYYSLSSETKKKDGFLEKILTALNW